MKKLLLFSIIFSFFLSGCSKDKDDPQFELNGTTWVYNTGTGGGIYIEFTSGSSCKFYSKNRLISPAGETTYGQYSKDGNFITFIDFVGGYYLTPTSYTWVKATLSTDKENMFAVYKNEDGKEFTRTFENRGY